MSSLRSQDYHRISRLMLLRLAENDMPAAEKLRLVGQVRASAVEPEVRWGSARRNISDLLKIINYKRERDNRAHMEEAELKGAILLYLSGETRHPDIEELTDALGNLREVRLGINKFPLVEGLKRIA
jgi:hypothetical protein